MVSNQTYYGSGTVYELEKPADFTYPSTKAAIKTFVETYCTADNQIGYLKNGFQAEVSTDTLEDQSDLGEMKISLITKENGTLTFALFNANGETISRLYPTAKTVDGVTTVGGLNGANQTDHIIVFVAATKVGSGAAATQTVLIAQGKNTSGFTLAWNPDSVEPFSCTYAMTPISSVGEMFRIADIANLPALPINSATTYSISYETNGGEWAASYEAPESYVHGAGDDVTLPTSSNITKEGYTFGGWYEAADLSTPVTTIDVSEDSGNKAYIAKWTV